MNIGKLEQIHNLRAIWAVEPRFSDWLVSEAGLEIIARDLEIEVENARREVRPGDYPCDVVGNILGDENHTVIIENQFGRTNHDHLGKLMTYAAVNRATTAVWIAEEVSDDHRSVIDWLNDNTPPQLNFYLAKIRAFRIGNSDIAPQFDVVCRPNAEVKKQRTQTTREEGEIQSWRLETWSKIHQYIEGRKPPFRLQTPGNGQWSVVTLGKSGFHLAMLLNPQRKSISAQFVASPNNWRDAAFDQLESRKERIETQLGPDLVWECKPRIKRARIFLEVQLDPRNSENSEMINAWFDEKLRLFYHCFEPIVRELKAPTLLLTDLSDQAFHEEENNENLEIQ